MSEIRQDRTTGTWSIIAPERNLRPHRAQAILSDRAPPPQQDPTCPFCPGNEKSLAGLIEEVRSDDPPGWRARVVPNKFPALSPVQSVAGLDDGLSLGAAGAVLPGHGHHEVIIEAPRHDADIRRLSRPDLDALLRVYHRRYRDLLARPGMKAVVVFRNHGSGGGASLAHPHSQILATGMTPPRLAMVRAYARDYHAREARCPTCDEIALEIDSKDRIVEVTEKFLVIVPFAASAAFELWILPRRHQADFGQCGGEELLEFGLVLRRALTRLATLLDDPPYKFAIESGGIDDLCSPFIHWRLRILPGLITPGGFELGTGLPINPSWPEESALMLRGTQASLKEADG
jgi:UDPglucose--hexose-1-phosphate uridylyltransferase